MLHKSGHFIGKITYLMVNKKDVSLTASEVKEIPQGSSNRQKRVWDTAQSSQIFERSSDLEELFRGYSRITFSESTSSKANTQIEVSSHTTTLTEKDSKVYTLEEDI